MSIDHGKFIPKQSKYHVRVLPPGAAKGPKRTIPELAEEFGVSTPCLRAYLARREGAPKAVLHHGQRAWYDLHEVREWWKGLER